jgi:murein DD-endopeptidase MepM/ murein hydrolase activator NlpD
MRKKSWNVVLVPEGDGAVRSLRIPARILHLAMIVGVLGVVLMAASVGLHLWSVRGLRTVTTLKQENATLRSHLSEVDQALNRVEGMVRDGERMEQQARLLAGLDPESGRDNPGQGGPFVDAEPAPALMTSDPRLRRAVDDQSRRLETLSQKASSQRKNLEQTLVTLKSLGDKLDHTPSICPVRGQVVLSSGFGGRPDPFTGQRAFHSGLDLRTAYGTPVHAAASGEVTEIGQEGEFGLTVHLTHGYGFETVYCHLSSASVRPGQQVRRGDTIGAVGTSGRSTGPHLHYEVHVGGAARDPWAYILTPRALID